MQMSRKHHYNTARLHHIPVKIHMHHTAALLDHDELHLLVPMMGHTGEIQRDTAKIGIVRKRTVSVHFIFSVSLKFCKIHRASLLLLSCNDSIVQYLHGILQENTIF